MTFANMAVTSELIERQGIPKVLKQTMEIIVRIPSQSLSWAETQADTHMQKHLSLLSDFGQN
jgi:hypothetical protein